MKKEPKLESIEDYKNEIKRLEKNSTIKNLIATISLILSIITMLKLDIKNETIHTILILITTALIITTIILYGLSNLENKQIQEYENKIEQIDTIKKAIKESDKF